MKTLKIFLLSLIITTISCSSDPSDPTDPCTDKKIVGFSLNDYPTTNTARQADLTFGEFNGNGFINTIAPSQTVTIGRISPNDANAYNPNTQIYSFLISPVNKIINFDKNNNLISESNITAGIEGCKGLVYSAITDKYYTVQTNSGNIRLLEFTDITNPMITITNTLMLYTGADASDAAFYQSYFGLVTDNNGTLYILNNKNIIEIDITNITSTTPVFHTMSGNTFQSVDKFTGLEYDENNNRLLFLVSAFNASFLELREVSLPLPTDAYGNQVKNLSTNHSDFNLEFSSTVLACDGTYIISNHIDNQPQIETKFISVQTNNVVTSATVPTHIFGLQKLN